MMGDDMPIKIQLESISEFFICPVCMCQLQTACITACGHRYCQKCIKECVDRHRKCPCCNKRLTQDDITRDTQFDSLIETINKEKETEEKEYFDTLINSATTSEENPVGVFTGDDRRHLSPIEEVFKKHWKQSLIDHEKYFKNVVVEFNRRKDQQQSMFLQRTAELQTRVLEEQDRAGQSAILNEHHESEISDLEKEMAKSAELIAEAYDRYLGDHVPNVAILPVRISINLLNRSVTIPDTELRPTDSLDEVRDMIKGYMEEQGNPVVEFGPECKFLAFGPFSKRSSLEMHRAAVDIVEHGASHPDIIVLANGFKPVIQASLSLEVVDCGGETQLQVTENLNLISLCSRGYLCIADPTSNLHKKPGSEIAVYGTVKCESDLPKHCFATTFESGQSNRVDYFTCKDCSFNWICRSCMECCHQDHEVSLYILNHQPTWACCYCPKKKKCILQN